MHAGISKSINAASINSEADMRQIILGVLFGLFSLAAQADAFSVVFKTHGNFSDVRNVLVSSIEGKGLKINHSNLIADMLERTGPAVGRTTRVYGQAEQFEFCSADISRAMMEADPHAIVMCPYSISIYNLPQDPKTIYLAFRKPGPTANPRLEKVLERVNGLLTSIIKETIEF